MQQDRQNHELKKWNKEFAGLKCFADYYGETYFAENKRGETVITVPFSGDKETAKQEFHKQLIHWKKSKKRKHAKKQRG